MSGESAEARTPPLSEVREWIQKQADECRQTAERIEDRGRKGHPLDRDETLAAHYRKNQQFFQSKVDAIAAANALLAAQDADWQRVSDELDRVFTRNEALESTLAALHQERDEARAMVTNWDKSYQRACEELEEARADLARMEAEQAVLQRKIATREMHIQQLIDERDDPNDPLARIRVTRSEAAIDRGNELLDAALIENKRLKDAIAPTWRTPEDAPLFQTTDDFVRHVRNANDVASQADALRAERDTFKSLAEHRLSTIEEQETAISNLTSELAEAHRAR